MGYSQQDSQELLSFLLDGLHEDLNQIENKPATHAVEIVALHSWKTYLKRNQSVIVDLLQGQYKSRIDCPDCGRVSVTFDPYENATNTPLTLLTSTDNGVSLLADKSSDNIGINSCISNK